MNTYVVCMDSTYVRGSEMVDTDDLSDEEFEEFDQTDFKNEQRWHEMEPNPFITIVKAETEEDACVIAGAKCHYDSRTLYAMEVKE